ncbi:MAG: DUF2268 domain-containing putative Zn-dependent protease [Caldisericia bacterium]
MVIINGFEDFKKLVYENKIISPYIWKENYYLKYKDVFDAMLEYLYHFSLDELLNIIKNVDFKELLIKGEISIKNNLIEEIVCLIKKCKNLLNFDDEFLLYFLVGLGHIDGTSLLTKDGTPFLYFGLERISFSNLNFLVPHEFNHLVRLSKFKSIKEKLKFKDYLIYEGLATYFSIYFNNFEINKKSEALSLFIPENILEYLYQNENIIMNEILEIIDKDMNNEIMFEYFTYDGEKKFKKGYFAGLKIIENLINSGFDIKNLTSIETDKILELFFQNI